MQFTAHLEGLREAMVAFVRSAERAGTSAAVPTTPDWTMRRLIAHQGTAHRWAAALIKGEDIVAGEVESAGRSAADPVEWLRDGAIEIVSALVAAPRDLVTPVFLANAATPKEFWGRRVCHETTIHAVDALSAELGRYPRAADATWISRGVALDGIDELVMGFIPRPVTRLRADPPQRIVVRPEGVEEAWQIEVCQSLPLVSRVSSAHADGDVVLDGDPVALYLTLWNRSDEVAVDADWDALCPM